MFCDCVFVASAMVKAGLGMGWDRSGGETLRECFSGRKATLEASLGAMYTSPTSLTSLASRNATDDIYFDYRDDDLVHSDTLTRTF